MSGENTNKSGENTNNTYTNVSDLPTMSEITSPAYVPVEDANKDGKKVDLNSVLPGTLNTSNTTAQTVNESESLTGAVNLHKVAKTGSYNDLLNKPSIPTLGYTRVSRQVSPQYHDTGIYQTTYTINVNNREAITATLDKSSSPYSKGVILELSDDCDDAIICINTNENDEVDYGFCKRGSNSLIQIVPVTPTIDIYDDGNILASNNYVGCSYEVPTDWSDVKLLDPDAKIATFDNQYSKLYSSGSGLNLIQFVVRIIADCAFYYPVNWKKS